LDYGGALGVLALKPSGFCNIEVTIHTLMVVCLSLITPIPASALDSQKELKFTAGMQIHRVRIIADVVVHFNVPRRSC
jgi:hypothetical protein